MRVTTAIPCFNAERWIAACVESALAQTWADKEVIVVDDGSTDASPRILENFGTAIRLLRGAHRGGNEARNLALEAASGEWVQFLDADDYLEPEKIAAQFAETAGGERADVIYSPTWIETPDAPRSLREIDPRLDVFGRWLAWQLPQTGGALWRKRALVEIGGWRPDQPCCQEHELYLRALQAGRRFVFAPTAHAVYRIWSDQTVCRRDPRLVIRVKTGLIDELRAWMIAQKTWQPEHQQIAGRACFEMARTLAAIDLPAGLAYHDERRARGLISLDGPAAPRRYRLVYRMAGFPTAEKLAARRRSPALLPA
ncbi:MAG: glycosyltransferase family A protein [Chthoniobacteraceae bacterium]